MRNQDTSLSGGITQNEHCAPQTDTIAQKEHPTDSEKKRTRGTRRERKTRLVGNEAWMKISDNLLSKQGKRIVSNDPNLTDYTIRKLVELQKGQLREIQFAFGEDDFGGEEDDVGCALLSTCIKDNLQSSWAEIVGRYADMRRLPFLEVAIGLRAYHEQYGMYYFDETRRIISWEPCIINVTPTLEEPLTVTGQDIGYTGMDGLKSIDDVLHNSNGRFDLFF